MGPWTSMLKLRVKRKKVQNKINFRHPQLYFLCFTNFSSKISIQKKDLSKFFEMDCNKNPEILFSYILTNQKKKIRKIWKSAKSVWFWIIKYTTMGENKYENIPVSIYKSRFCWFKVVNVQPEIGTLVRLKAKKSL